MKITEILSDKKNIIAIQCILYVLLVSILYLNYTILQWIGLVVIIGLLNMVTYIRGISKGMVLQAVKDEDKIQYLWNLLRRTDGWTVDDNVNTPN